MALQLWKIAEGNASLPDPWEVKDYVPFAWLDERLRKAREEEWKQKVLATVDALPDKEKLRAEIKDAIRAGLQVIASCDNRLKELERLMPKVNAAGLNLIKSFESCRLHAYLDSVGVPTIGWGHTRGVKLGQAITQAQADAMFEQDVQQFASEVAALVHVQLTPNQFAALVSFAYNVGTGDKGLGGSTLLQLVNEGKFAEAASEFEKWDKAKGQVLPGLKRRRDAERDLFLTK